MYSGLFLSASILGYIVLLFYLCFLKKLSQKSFYFLPFIILLGIWNIYDSLFFKQVGLGSTISFRIYGFLEFYTLFYYFKKINSKYRLALNSVGVAYFLSHLMLLFYWKQIPSLVAESYLMTFEIVLVYLFSCTWFIQQFKMQDYQPLKWNPDFYFVSGLILYFSGIYVLTLYANTIIENNISHFPDYWNLMIACNIVLRLFILIGLWKKVIR